MKKVLVITGMSLLAHGLVSRLRDYSQQFDIRALDLSVPNFLEDVIVFKPDIIIFDESDFKDSHANLVTSLLNSVPDAIMLELLVNSSNVQIIHSVRYAATNVDDVVQILKTSGSIADTDLALLGREKL